MQAPGGPEEDTSSGFKYGGWVAPYFVEADNAAGELMARQMKPADLLLGRKTFEIFAAYWPSHADYWPGISEVTKYVVSQTMDESHPLAAAWSHSVFLESVEDIKRLRDSEGADIQVHGSGHLVQTLLRHDLVDELWLKTITLHSSLPWGLPHMSLSALDYRSGAPWAWHSIPDPAPSKIRLSVIKKTSHPLFLY